MRNSMAYVYDRPIAYATRIYDLLAPFFGEAINKAAADLSRKTNCEAWPRPVGRGGGANSTPVSGRHIVSLLLAAMGRPRHGRGDSDIAATYARIRTLSIPEQGSAILTLAELLARHALGRDGEGILEDFAETGAWLGVHARGETLKIFTGYDRALPEHEYVLFTPYGEPDPAPPAAIREYRCIPMAAFLALATSVRDVGMAKKPLGLPLAEAA